MLSKLRNTPQQQPCSLLQQRGGLSAQQASTRRGERTTPTRTVLLHAKIMGRRMGMRRHNGGGAAAATVLLLLLPRSILRTRT